MNNEISAEDFKAWKEHPVTKEVHKTIASVRNRLAESLINGSTLKGEHGSTAEETAKVVGVLYGADLFLKAEFMDDTEV